MTTIIPATICNVIGSPSKNHDVMTTSIGYEFETGTAMVIPIFYGDEVEHVPYKISKDIAAYASSAFGERTIGMLPLLCISAKIRVKTKMIST